MYLSKENIRLLKENEIKTLCNIAGINKLKNIVIDYKRDNNTKGIPYGKNSKEWKNIDSENPKNSFVVEFFIYKFLKEETLNEDILKQFEIKLLKTLLGKSEYENATKEKIETRLEKQEGQEKTLLLKVFGLEEKAKAIEEDSISMDEEENSRIDNVKDAKDKYQKKIDDAVAKTKKQDKKEYDALKKKYDSLQTKYENVNEEKNELMKNNEALTKQLDSLKEENSQLSTRHSDIKAKLTKIMKMSEKQFKEEDLCLEKDNVFELLSLIKDEVTREHIEEAKEILIRAYITIGLLARGQK